MHSISLCHKNHHDVQHIFLPLQIFLVRLAIIAIIVTLCMWGPMQTFTDPWIMALVTNAYLLNVGLRGTFPLHPIRGAHAGAAHTLSLMRPTGMLSLAVRTSPSIHTDAPVRSGRPLVLLCQDGVASFLRRPRHS